MVRVGTPNIVVGEDAPDHVQHMANDVTDAFNRVATATNDLTSDIEALQIDVGILQTDVGTLQTDLDTVEAALPSYAPLASPTFTGVVTAPTVVLSGGQVAFPAAQSASADANTLDDYEEGTFTPGFAFGGGTTGIVYDIQLGSYTKIGRLVYITAEVRMSNKGASAGFWNLTGLPFTAAAVYSPALAVWLNNMNMSAAGEGQYALVNTGATTVAIYEMTNAVTSVQMDNSYATNTSYVIVSGFYFV